MRRVTQYAELEAEDGSAGRVTSDKGKQPLLRAQVAGSPQDFPKTKEAYVNWGDLEEDGERGARFRGEPLEPYTAPLAK